MKDVMKTQQDLVTIAQKAAAIPGVVAVYLFGSQSSGATHKGSDVDIGILSDNPEFNDRLAYHSLPAATEDGKEIDYRVIKPGQSLTFLSRATLRGTLLVTNDEKKRVELESLILRMWSDWQFKLKIQETYRRKFLKEKT